MGFPGFQRFAFFVLKTALTIVVYLSLVSPLHAEPPANAADQQTKSDAIKARLEKAKTTFASASADDKEAFLAAIDARINSAADAGDLAKVNALKIARISVETEGTLPDTVNDAIVIAARNRYVTGRKAAYATMVLAYSQGIRDFTREHLIDDAATTQAELDAQEKTVGARLASEAIPIGTNMLDKMVLKGNGKKIDGGIRLTRDGTLITPNKIKVPFRAEIIEKTDSTNIRMAFNKAEVILNWESRRSELRFSNPANGAIAGFGGKGNVPPNEFVKIVWVVDRDSSTISVNGQERATINGDFDGLESELSVYAAADGSVITVKSVIVGPVPAKTDKAEK